MKLTDLEIAALAAFKGMAEFDFVQQYTRLRDDRRGLVLKENPNGSCAFLNGNDCAVQPVKPQQCRDFPNGWNFPGFEKLCRARPREASQSEFDALVGRKPGMAPEYDPVK